MKNLGKFISRYCFLFFTFLFSCTYHDVVRTFDCTTSDLVLLLSEKSNPTGCITANGSITVLATGGKQPYTYSADGTTFQSSNSIQNLGAGSFTVVVKDANGCQKSISVSLTNAASTLDVTATTTPDTGCAVHNGTITLKGASGVAPYQYQLSTNGYVSSATFSSLASGAYSLSIKDSKGCTKTLSVTVLAGAGSASYATDIAPLLTNYCNSAGCHSANSGRSLTTYARVQSGASAIKSRTASGNMPPGGGLTQAQISLIACWVNAGAPNN